MSTNLRKRSYAIRIVYEKINQKQIDEKYIYNFKIKIFISKQNFFSKNVPRMTLINVVFKIIKVTAKIHAFWDTNFLIKTCVCDCCCFF